MTQRNLNALLAAHSTWIASGTQAGERADLSGESLDEVDLAERDLRGADLRDADLRGAKLVHRVGFNELDLPRGHGHETLLAIARILASALPELDGVLASVATAAWTQGLGEGLDCYEACALSGSNASLSIFTHIARCDTNAGPVETGRSTTFTLELAGARLSLGWSGTGTLVFRGGERAIAERLADAGVQTQYRP